MGEASTLAKIVIILGIVFLLIGLIYPGQDAAWNGFRTALSTGPSFPRFDDPFLGDRFGVNDSIIADGSVAPASVTNTGSVPACTTSATPASNWWGCVVTKDAGVSFFTASNIAQARVKMGNLDAATTYSVLSVEITIQCHGNSADRTVDFLFRKADDTTLIGEFPAQVMTCHVGAFENVSARQELSPAWPIVGDFNGGTVQFNPSGSASFSYLSVRLIVSSQVAQADCAGADTLTYIGCVLGGFFNFLIKSARWVINGLVFIVATLVALGTFIFNVVTNLLFGLFSMFSWFFAIPGAPPVVQILVASIFVGLIAWVLFVVMKSAVGLFGGINPL